MPRPNLKEWPHNGQPSTRHVWKETFTHTTQAGHHAARCLRCGRGFNSFADTRGPVYCYPIAEWIAAHPDDDGMLGERRTPFG